MRWEGCRFACRDLLTNHLMTATSEAASIWEGADNLTVSLLPRWDEALDPPTRIPLVFARNHNHLPFFFLLGGKGPAETTPPVG